ncbi:MAG: ABC transporter substrate-binding protein [Methylophagaceae bacterium]
MRRFWPLILFVVIFIVAVLGIKFQPTNNEIQRSAPQKIISLAPSITETIFALGLGNKVIAVTDYCDFPSQVLNLPKVGGFINPNLEAIVALQPDLVILLANQQQTIDQLQQLNIPVLSVYTTTLADIKQTIDSIGQRTQHQQQSQQLLTTINQKIMWIEQQVSGLTRPRVMITMGHSIGSEHMKNVFIAGQNDFYNDLITLAGGNNAYQDSQINVPSLSIEGILQLNPQVIIDIFPEANDHHANLNQVLKQWHALKYIDAVQYNRIHIIEQDYATTPGPRVFLLLEQFARLIHPELDWDSLTP